MRIASLVKDRNDAQKRLIATMKAGAILNTMFKRINVLLDYHLRQLKVLVKKRW